MTKSEFKAWFEGFSENIEKTPSPVQWKKIKDRVKEIDDTPTTYPVFVDRYRDIYRDIYRPYYGGNVYCGVTGDAGSSKAEYKAEDAMRSLGMQDYKVTL